MIGQDSEQITASKQAIVQSILEIEQQDEAQRRFLLTYAAHLRLIADKIEGSAMAGRVVRSRQALMEAFLPASAWSLILDEVQTREARSYPEKFLCGKWQRE